MHEVFAFLAGLLVLVGSAVQAVHAMYELAHDELAVEASSSSTRRDRLALRHREAREAYGWSFITLGALFGVLATWPW